MLTLIHGATVYAPAEMGPQDIFIGADRILGIADAIDLPPSLEVERIDATGKIVTPGFIDLHVHITGGGGEGGPATRVPEIQLGKITTAGVTTVLGVLGTDDVSRHPETLLAKAQGLEQEGITAYIMSGSYQFPNVVTVTGSLRKDIALIPHVVGVGEIAVSDHRSAQPTFEDLAKIAADARVGGMLGQKAGLVQLHMGEGERGMSHLFRLIEETEIPISQLLPTHVTRSRRLFEDALRFVKMGGNIDITAPGSRLSMKLSVAEALENLVSAGGTLSQVTFSSDGNGSMPVFDDAGNLTGLMVGEIGNVIEQFRELVTLGVFPVSEILKCLTSNPARRIRLQTRKGSIAQGMDADLILFDPDWRIDRVYAKGRLMVKEGQPTVKGTFE